MLSFKTTRMLIFKELGLDDCSYLDFEKNIKKMTLKEQVTNFCLCQSSKVLYKVTRWVCTAVYFTKVTSSILNCFKPRARAANTSGCNFKAELKLHRIG